MLTVRSFFTNIVTNVYARVVLMIFLFLPAENIFCQKLHLNDLEYFETTGLNVFVFSNPETTNPVLRSEIVRLYNRQEIAEQIPVATEKALKDFYEENKDSLYYQLAKVNIYAVVDSSKDVINEMKHKLEQNVPFEKLAGEILVKTYIRGRDGTLDTYLEDEPPYLGEAAFRLKLYETAGPIEYSDTAKGRQYALMKCMAIREAKQLTYDDVKKTIADDFENYHRSKIAQSVEEQLKKKYVVTIYKDVLRQALLQIGINPDQ